MKQETEANGGCPDADGDGVVDKDDKCPSVVGESANAGCPWPDTDGDGVLDKDDKCPNEAGVPSNNGCVEVIMETAEIILFDFDSTSFKSGVTEQLDAISEIMNKFPDAKFTIEGHTDSLGGKALNNYISVKRANNVLDYLVSKNVEASRLTASGSGESSPAASNATSEGRAKNRRVEINVEE